MIKKVGGVLNRLALVFSLFLVVYGFHKGYDLVELVIYNIYFVVMILAQVINLFRN